MNNPTKTRRTAAAMLLAAGALLFASCGGSSSSADQVTYECDGNAPDGVNITVGSATEPEATTLPFERTDKLSDTAYMLVQAQLQGGGNVDCSITVDAFGETHTNSDSTDEDNGTVTVKVCVIPGENELIDC